MKTTIKSTLRMGAASLLLACGATPAFADSFQYEAGGGLGKGEVGSVGVDTLAVRGLYYLRPVSLERGPFAEAPFLDQAAHIGATWLKADPDQGSAFKSLGVDGHFVTETHLIIDASLDREDAGGQAGTSNNIAAGVGLYLDDRTTGMLRLALDDDAADTTTLGADLRHLADGGAAGTWIAYEAGASLIHADHTGFALTAEGTYYLSSQLGVSAGLDFTKIKNGDETAFTLGATYYLNAWMSGSVEYQKASGDGPDNNNLLLGVAMRF